MGLKNDGQEVVCKEFLHISSHSAIEGRPQ